MDARRQIIAWLRDVHALEQSLEHVLQMQAKDAQQTPELLARLEQHLSETIRHKDMVGRALLSLDETPSGVKSMAAGVMGMMQGMTLAVFRDETLKCILTDYAMEHFEIACYRSLRVAATEAGFPAIAEMCEQILKDETAMAEWLEEQIPDFTRSHVNSLAEK
jgi:ferritin-like metal-binding protein YciE